MSNLIYLIKFFIRKFFVRKYKISPINNSYNFTLNDYLINDNNHLDNLFAKYGSDKGGTKKSKYLGWNPHNYAQIYDQLFYKYRKKKMNFLEVGIGSVDQNIKSALPSFCKSGASLRAFRDYFIKANIIGCDIDPKVIFKDKRIFTDIVDQTSQKSVVNFFKKINKLFFIIIDDGLHEFHANSNFFKIAINYLSKDGYYIIEDVNEFKMQAYYDFFLKFKKKFYITVYNINNKKFLGRSNNLILIQKR